MRPFVSVFGRNYGFVSSPAVYSTPAVVATPSIFPQNQIMYNNNPQMFGFGFLTGMFAALRAGMTRPFPQFGYPQPGIPGYLTSPQAAQYFAANNAGPSPWYSQQGYPQPGYSYPQQGYAYPQQTYPQQAYPQPGYTYPQQTYPQPQVSPQQQQQVYPQQVYPQQIQPIQPASAPQVQAPPKHTLDAPKTTVNATATTNPPKSTETSVPVATANNKDTKGSANSCQRYDWVCVDDKGKPAAQPANQQNNQLTDAEIAELRLREEYYKTHPANQQSNELTDAEKAELKLREAHKAPTISEQYDALGAKIQAEEETKIKEEQAKKLAEEKAKDEAEAKAKFNFDPRWVEEQQVLAQNTANDWMHISKH